MPSNPKNSVILWNFFREWEHWVLEDNRILTISTTNCEDLSTHCANPSKVWFQIYLSRSALWNVSQRHLILEQQISEKPFKELSTAPQQSSKPATQIKWSKFWQPDDAVAWGTHSICILAQNYHNEEICSATPGAGTGTGAGQGAGAGTGARTGAGTPQKPCPAGGPGFRQISSAVQAVVPSPPGHKCL